MTNYHYNSRDAADEEAAEAAAEAMDAFMPKKPDHSEPEPPAASQEPAINDTINDNVEVQHGSLFEDIRMESEDGGEYWSARDLAKVLGYSKWEKFKNAIDRAEIACENSGQSVEDHFRHTTRVSTFGRGAQREIEDVHMSRYGCYLLVQNADPAKPAVAMGQTYFAVQTRRQEETDQLAGLTEDQRRLYLRGEISVYNRKLAEAANLAGVIEPVDFAIFTDHGYMGLYGGLKSRDIQKRKSLKPSQHILDHMSGTELAANLFRVTQTEDKLRREGVQGKTRANQTHYDVGRKVRQTIQELGGSPPEELPVPGESVQQLRRKEEKRLKGAQQAEQGQYAREAQHIQHIQQESQTLLLVEHAADHVTNHAAEHQDLEGGD